jgi:nitrogenase molybdenum-iron protein alpha chain
MCHRSINYLAEMMDKKYGIPWFKVNFIGAEASAKSLIKIAKYFGSSDLVARTEKFCEDEMAKVDKVRNIIRERCKNKTAMIFVGGSRAHHYQELFRELGMKTVAAGYEFAHRDDYEGRKVLPSIKVDADSRNIEEIKVEADPVLYKPRKSKEELAALTAQGIQFGEYEGMMPEMDPKALIIDDLNHHEMEMLIDHYHPDIFCAGIKEKYVVQKYGVPLKQLHSYDYSGPYVGFQGAINFYREIDRMVNTRVWGLVTPPWKGAPELTATYGCD